MRGSEKLDDIAQKNEARIRKEVLCDDLQINAEPTGYVKDWNVNGEDVSFGVERLK